MKVKTLKKHNNPYPPQFVKHPGRKYDLPEREARALIATGLVEEDKPKAANDEHDSED